MFADNTTILSSDKNQLIVTDNLQKSIDNIETFIKINVEKSVHVNYTLRNTENIKILLIYTIITQKDSAKYLGMYISLNWKFHMRGKNCKLKKRCESSTSWSDLFSS